MSNAEYLKESERAVLWEDWGPWGCHRVGARVRLGKESEGT